MFHTIENSKNLYSTNNIPKAQSYETHWVFLGLDIERWDPVYVIAIINRISELKLHVTSFGVEFIK